MSEKFPSKGWSRRPSLQSGACKSEVAPRNLRPLLMYLTPPYTQQSFVTPTSRCTEPGAESPDVPSNFAGHPFLRSQVGKADIDDQWLQTGVALQRMLLHLTCPSTPISYPLSPLWHGTSGLLAPSSVALSCPMAGQDTLGPESTRTV